MDSHFHFYHSAKGAGKGRLKWPVRILFLLACLGLAALLWYLVSPVSFARALGSVAGKPLEIAGLELEVDRAPRILAPGATLRLNPDQNLGIVRLLSNRWLNYDLSLRSPDFDPAAFSGGGSSFLAIMGEEAFSQPKVFALEVLDKGNPMARFSIEVAFSFDDIIRRGDNAKDPAVKARHYRRALELEPDNPAARERLAQALTEAGGGEEELSGLLEGLLAEAGDDDAKAKGLLLRLLAAYQALGDGKGEIRTFERLSELAGKAGESQYVYKANLANLYRESEPRKAAELYEGMLLEPGEEGKALANLSILLGLYQRLGDNAMEAKTQERLLPLVPQDQVPGVWNALVRLREAQNDPEGLIAAWDGLAGSLPKGQTKVDAYKHLAFLHAQRKDYDKAEAAYRAASELDPTDPTIFLNLAALANERGDREAYRANLEKTVPLAASDNLRLQLARAYTEDGLRDKALELWLSLAELSPDTEEKTALRSEARARILDLSRPPDGQVSDDFERLLYQYSWNSVEFYNLGVTHFKAKNWDRAEKAFLQALDIGEGNQAWVRDIHGYLLAIYKEKGDRAKLLSEAMGLYRDDPSQKDYRDLAAMELEAAKDWKGLEAAAKDWVAIAKDDPDNWRYLALAQKSLGDNVGMANSLFSAAGLEPKSVPSWLAAGDALEQAGDIQRAKIAFQNVIALDDQNDKATQALLRFTLSDLSSSRGSASGSGSGPGSGRK
jgi:tetratricopeptide (TPR) repeat protein